MHMDPKPNAGGPHDEWTADTAMLLLLMLARKGEVSAGKSIKHKTLGLLGSDPVAQAIARRACQGFDMRVMIYDALGRGKTIARQLGADISPSLGHLLAEADIVSLHGDPGSSATVINARRLNQMKPDACLINTGSGELVDEQALLHALWFETIGGVGICVPQSTSPHQKQLCACENAVVLPHLNDAPAPITVSPSMIAHRTSTPNNVVQLFDGSQRPG